MASRTPGWFLLGWAMTAYAALLMVATLPGRTHGLGLVTEPLLADGFVDRVTFGWCNFGATLIGAAFAFPIGWAIERSGTRLVGTLVLLTLGLATWLTAWATDLTALAVGLILSRGLGQVGLSLVSLALVSQWFVQRLPQAMGLFSILLTIGSMVVFGLVGAAATPPDAADAVSGLAMGWRPTWHMIGTLLVLGLAPLTLLCVRSTPEAVGLKPDGVAGSQAAIADLDHGATLGQAARSPAFWAFGIASFLFILVSSATTLHGEAILRERGLSRQDFILAVLITAGVSLIFNFLGGWWASAVSPRPVMVAGLLATASGLLALQLLHGTAALYGFAVCMGISGGLVLVAYFAVWGAWFGRAHLGSILGAAQVLTTLGSALGQGLPGWTLERTGSFDPMLAALVPPTLIAALGVMCVARPRGRSHKA